MPRTRSHRTRNAKRLGCNGVRVAIVSDFHGNLAALDAVVADVERQSPDAVYHAGDLAHLGPRPAEVVDRIRELGWEGVTGNWDCIYNPGQAERITSLPERNQKLFVPLLSWTQERLGPERIDWLGRLPRVVTHPDFTLVHAGPNDLWTAPPRDTPDDTLIATYGEAGTPTVIYAHIHTPFVRQIGDQIIANTGSAGMPFDGDWRSSYLLLEDGIPSIQRVEYDIEREAADLRESCHPFPEWLEGVQRTGKFSVPE